MSYVETAIAEAVAASEKEEAAKVETTETVTTEETTEPEGQQETTEETSTEEQPFPKKAVNALARKDKKITKLASERDTWRERALEYERRLNAPAPTEEEYEGKPYGDYLKAVAKDEARKTNIEQALEAAKEQATQLEAELAESVNAVLEESAERLEKTFPDARKVIESHATLDRGDGEKVIPLSQVARDVFSRSEDPFAPLYAILKEGKLDVLNSLPPIEAAMMVKEYEIKAQSLPKIKHVSSAPEPITSARGVAAGGKSLEQMNPQELLALVR